MDDTLFNSLFVADESATVTEKSETTAWPIYPSEKPTKAEKILWLQRFEYDARMSGYSASLRREDPFEIAKLAERPLIRIPDGIDPAKRTLMELENARTEVNNELLRAEATSRRMELGNRFYARLAASMRPRASLRLAELMKKYQYKDASGKPIPDSYNGIEMFLKLREEMSDPKECSIRHRTQNRRSRMQNASNRSHEVLTMPDGPRCPNLAGRSQGH